MLNKYRLTSGWPAAPMAAVLLLLTLSVGVQAQAQEIELRSYPLPGQQQRHTMEMRQTMTGTLSAAEGADEKTRAAVQTRLSALAQGLKMQSEMVSRQETSAEDAQGNYRLRFQYERARTIIQSESGGSREIASPLAHLEMQAVLNQARGDITDITVLNSDADPKLLDKVGKSISGAVGALKGLEGQTLRIGEPIETPFAMELPMPVPGAGNQMKATMRSTLVALEDGVATIDSVISLTFEIERKAPSGTATLKARGSGQGGGSMKWRLSDRLVLQSQQSLQMLFDMDMPDGSAMRMQSQMELQSRGESIPAR
jgi:hypothetical protein